MFVYVCNIFKQFVKRSEKMEPANQIILQIEGMSCPMCTEKVEKALKRIAGVTSVFVDLEKKEAIITGSAA